MAWLLLHLQQVAETQRVAGAAEAVRMFGEHFVCFTIDVLGDPISSIVTWANEDAQGNWQSLMTLVALIIP